MAVNYEVIRAHPEPRVRAFIDGNTVTFREMWRCSCGKNDNFGRICRHVRAASRELPENVGIAVDDACERLGMKIA